MRFNGHKLSMGLTLVATSALLVSCSGVQKQLGLTRSAPDEFAVVSQAPLSLPPDYSLRPPEPGAPRPQEGTQADQAAAELFGKGSKVSRSSQYATLGGNSGVTAAPVTPVEQVSRGEDQLLQLLGADKAEPNIRQIVDQESTELARASESFADSILFWRTPAEPGTVVDADAERRRLQENQALGQPLDSGETPTIKRKSKALLEGLFDF